MNILLWTMLLFLEICPAVLTISEGRTEFYRSRNKLMARGAQAAAFLLFALFPGVDFGFRYRMLILLIVLRILIAAAGFVMQRCSSRRRAAAEMKKRSVPSIVAGVIFSAMLLTAAMIPSFLFSDYAGLKSSGEYKVLTTSTILVDPEREEQFLNDGSKREVPLDFFYPDAEGREKFPLIIFSHGAFGFYRSNYSLYEELASNGYVVASLSHPYHSFYCKNTKGKTVLVDPEFMRDTLYINEEGITEEEIYALTGKWMKLRTDDINFVLDTLEGWNETGTIDEARPFGNSGSFDESVLLYVDFDKIGLIGHSLGGAASVEVGRMRKDIDAVVNLDGTMLGEQKGLVDCEPYECEGKKYVNRYELNEEPYPVAILNMDNQEHHDSRIAAKEVEMPYANNAVMDNAVRGFDTYYVNSGHMNFTDLPLFSPSLAGMLGTGDIDAKECIETVNGLVKNFYDDTLKGRATFVVEEAYGN